MSSTASPPVFEDPDANKGPLILFVTGIMTGIALLFVFLRIFVRTFVVRSFGLDDGFMCLAMGTAAAGFAVIIPEVYYGAGQHFTNITTDQMVTGLKYNFITQPIYLWAISLIKLSIGAFLLRLAVRKVFYWTILSVMIFLSVYTLAAFFTIIFQCRPIARSWDRSVPGTCFTPAALQGLSYFNAVTNIITDFAFAILPIPMLWDLRINRRQKTAIMGILSLGFFASSACIVKTTFIKNYGKTGDFLYDSTNLTIWTVVEASVGIIAASIPVLKPLFKVILGSTYRTSHYNGKVSTDAFGRKRPSAGYTKHGQSQDKFSQGETGSYGLKSFPKDGSSKHLSTISNAKQSHATASKSLTGDDDSEQFILVKGPMQHDAELGIVKTTEVTIVKHDQDQLDTEAQRHNEVSTRTGKSPLSWHQRFKQ